MKTYIYILSILLSIGQLAFVQSKDVEIKGTVTDLSNKPVKNHLVIIKYAIEKFYQDTVYTDSKGKFLYLVKNGKDLGNDFSYTILVSDCKNTLIEKKAIPPGPIVSFKICINNK